jgi:hypothetical protein
MHDDRNEESPNLVIWCFDEWDILASQQDECRGGWTKGAILLHRGEAPYRQFHNEVDHIQESDPEDEGSEESGIVSLAGGRTEGTNKARAAA